MSNEGQVRLGTRVTYHRDLDFKDFRTQGPGTDCRDNRGHRPPVRYAKGPDTGCEPFPVRVETPTPLSGGRASGRSLGPSSRRTTLLRQRREPTAGPRTPRDGCQGPSGVRPDRRCTSWCFGADLGTTKPSSVVSTTCRRVTRGGFRTRILPSKSW